MKPPSSLCRCLYHWVVLVSLSIDSLDCRSVLLGLSIHLKPWSFGLTMKHPLPYHSIHSYRCVQLVRYLMANGNNTRFLGVLEIPISDSYNLILISGMASVCFAFQQVHTCWVTNIWRHSHTYSGSSKERTGHSDDLPEQRVNVGKRIINHPPFITIDARNHSQTGWFLMVF